MNWSMSRRCIQIYGPPIQSIKISMYTRKFTQMNFWYKMNLMKSQGLLPLTEDFDLMNKFQPNQNYPAPLQRTTQNNSVRKSVDSRIVKRLLARYPELKYVPSNIQTLSPEQRCNTSSENIVNFIEQTKAFMRRGYNEDKAFEKSEHKYQAQLQKRIEQNRLTRGLAMDNQMRSFMNLYQQEVEMESSAKVKRVYQDVAKRELIKEKQAVIQQEVEEKEALLSLRQNLHQEDDGLSDYEDTPPQEDSAQLATRLNYTRVLHKVLKTAPESGGELQSKEKRREAVQNFKEGNENLFKHYYERAATLDRIGGLSEEELMKMLQTSPTKFQRQQKKLLALLNKHKVKLDSEGEVDWSGCEDERVIRRLHDDPYVKMTLMQKDLHFEVPVKMHKSQQAQEYRRRLEALQETSVQDIEMALSQEEQQEDSFNLEYEDVIFKEKTYMETHDRAQEDSKLNKEMTQSERVRLERLEPLLAQIDDKDSYYRFFENYGERLKRIEEKWLRSRIQDLEGDVSAEGLSQKHKELNDLLSDFRRVKFNMEQTSQEKAGDLLFEEHSVFSKEELMLSHKHSYEQLQGYFQLEPEARRYDFKRQQRDDKITEAVKPKVVALDVADPVFEEGRFRQTAKDSLEVLRGEYKSRAISQMIEDIKTQAQLQQGKGMEGMEETSDVSMKESVERYVRMQENGGVDTETITKSQLISAVKKKTAQGDKKKKKLSSKKKETDFQKLANQNQLAQEEREKAMIEKLRKEKEAKKNIKGL